MGSSKGTNNSKADELFRPQHSTGLPNTDDNSTSDSGQDAKASCALLQQIKTDMTLSQKLNEPFNAHALTANNKSSKQADSNTYDKQQKSHKQRLSHKTNNQSNATTDIAQLAMDKQVNYAGVVHPNFDAAQSPLDTNRDLHDIPSPPLRYEQGLNKLFDSGSQSSTRLGGIVKGKNDWDGADSCQQQSEDYTPSKCSGYNGSMWSLIATPELASHLELLQLGGLIDLPEKFFMPTKVVSSPSKSTNNDNWQETQAKQSSEHPSHPSSLKTATFHKDGDCHEGGNRKSSCQKNNYRDSHELLSPLTEMQLLDLSDIHQVYEQYPSITRYGFADSCNDEQDGESNTEIINKNQSKQSSHRLLPNIPEMINDVFAPTWELVLYPERFDNGVDSLATDILACSVAVHILQQCQPRKSVNKSVTVYQICQHMRSYVLNQCKLMPQFEPQYRNIRLFMGHVIVAAAYLGLHVSQTAHHTATAPTNDNGVPSENLGQPIYLNISSRCSLLSRYPNISRYYINGWS